MTGEMHMKAVVQDRYGGPEHLRLTELPLPEPGAGELRLRVSTCAVNLSEWEYLTGSPLLCQARRRAVAPA